jgi:hypothetical protein
MTSNIIPEIVAAASNGLIRHNKVSIGNVITLTTVIVNNKNCAARPSAVGALSSRLDKKDFVLLTIESQTFDCSLNQPEIFVKVSKLGRGISVTWALPKANTHFVLHKGLKPCRFEMVFDYGTCADYCKPHARPRQGKPEAGL